MHESVVKTKRLTEAAAAAAIAAMFVLLKLAAPFLVVVTMIVSPAPIAAVACFSGMRWALGTSAAVILLVMMTGGPEIGLTTAAYAGALGLAMGYGFRRGFSYRKTMGLTLAAYLVEMTYKIIFSVQVLGLPVLTGGAQERYTEFLHWVTEAIVAHFGVTMAEGELIFTACAGLSLALLLLLDGVCYTYLSMELFSVLLKRLRAARR